MRSNRRSGTLLQTGDASDWEKSRCGQDGCPTPCATHCTTGPTWKLANPFGVKGKPAQSVDGHARSTITATARLAQDDFTTQGLLKTSKSWWFVPPMTVAHSKPIRDTAEKRCCGHQSCYLPWRPDKAMTLADLDAWNLLWTVAGCFGRGHQLIRHLPRRAQRSGMTSSISSGAVSAITALEQIVRRTPHRQARSRTSSPRREQSGRWRQSSRDQFRSAMLYELASWIMRAVGRSSFHLGHAQQQHARDAAP